MKGFSLASYGMDAKIEIESQSIGKGRIRAIARREGEVAFVDELYPAKASDRKRFIDGLVEKLPGLKGNTEAQGQIEAELVRAVGEPSAANDTVPGDEADEIDVRRIVRPELFFTPEVSGLTVATVTAREGRPTAQWVMYLRWAGGSRKRAGLSDSLILPNGGQRLWLHPVPGQPAAGHSAPWSARARKAWLAGEAAPHPAEVFEQILERIAHHLEFPRESEKGIAATLGLWAMFTYVYPAWPAVPYLYLGGPLGSGKSHVFEVLARLAFRPLRSSNLSAAALFRTLHERGGTLMYDEAERLREKTGDISETLSMLLAGYKRGGRATRLEPLGDGRFKTMEFDVFGPKAMACIAGLPPALASRAISVMMFRAGPDSPKPRRRLDADPGWWQAIRDDLHALALEHGADWLALSERSDVCPKMGGRQYELWQPLLALAGWIEDFGAKGLRELMIGHALASIEAGKDDDTPDADLILLRTLAGTIVGGHEPSATEVLESARRTEPELFRNWRATTVGRHIKRYGLTTHHSGDRRYRNVDLEDLRRVQRNYGIDLGIPDTPPEVMSNMSITSTTSISGAISTPADGQDGHLDIMDVPRRGTTQSKGDER